MVSYRQQLESRIRSVQSHLCVGIDLRIEKVDGEAEVFLKNFIAETLPYTAAYKPNSAYFEAHGSKGMWLLEKLREWIPAEVPLILDAKRGDIGETQKYYAKFAFDVIQADAVTLNPYMGSDTLVPFLEYENKGLYLLGVTSNAGAAEIQQARMDNGQYVFTKVVDMTKVSPEVGLVLGLTNASGELLPHLSDVPLLIPGLGAQGGDLNALKGSQRRAPLLVNVSRAIMYHQNEKSSFAQVAKDWQAQIEMALS
jgi:orotidine 5'-phosphate decarboxylase subfamily 2